MKDFFFIEGPGGNPINDAGQYISGLTLEEDHSKGPLVVEQFGNGANDNQWYPCFFSALNISQTNLSSQSQCDTAISNAIRAANSNFIMLFLNTKWPNPAYLKNSCASHDCIPSLREPLQICTATPTVFRSIKLEIVRAMFRKRIFPALFLNDFRKRIKEDFAMPETDFQLKAVDPSSKDAKWCFEQYFAELKSRFERGFDPALSIPAVRGRTDASRRRFAHCLSWDGACRLRGAEVSSGRCRRNQAHVGISQSAGQGIRQKITPRLGRFCKKGRNFILHLETNKSLIEAIDLYRKSGYQEVKAFNEEPYAHHWFEKRL